MNKTKQIDQTRFDSARFDAAGYRTLHDIIETEQFGQLLSTTLVRLAGIEPGDAVLDVAGGYGEPSLAAARAVGPQGRVVCNDISGAMLAFGRERIAAAGLDNVEFIEADAQQLDFAAETFDAVLSRCGLMFLPDVAGTLRRLHTFLKPGGHLAASVWGPQPSVQMTAGLPVIVRELAVPPPPPGAPGPFALADPSHLASLVAGAGFHDVETGTLNVILEADTPEQFTEFAKAGAPAMIIDLVKAQPPEVQTRVWEKVTAAYREFQGADGRVQLENHAIWVVGAK